MLICSFGCTINNTSPNLYKKTKYLEETTTSYTLDSVIGFVDADKKFQNLENKVIHKLNDSQTIWLYINNVTLENQQYLSIWSPYTDQSQLFIKTKNDVITLSEITLLKEVDYNSIYRFPSWKLPVIKDSVNIFIKIKDTKRATGLKLLLQNEKDYMNFIKVDYYKISFIAVLLFSMLIIVITLFIAKKQYSLLWYAAYILTFIIEFYLSQGLDLELNLFNSPTFQATKKILLQSLGGLFLSLFFINFYTFSTSTKAIKNIFKILVFVYSVAFFITITFLVVNKVYLPKIVIWLPLRFAIITVLIAHIIMIKKQKLPAYLGISFTFPIIGYLIFAYYNYPHDLNLISYFLLENTLQIAIILEIVFMLYYIINQLVKAEFLAIQLNKENLKLRSSFQENILNVQERERRNLLSNVHDSFGGYLEALKIRLLQKNNDSNKIKEILDAFYKEYRYLLNSLYAPKINATNFTESLTEFIIKIDKLTETKISYSFDIQETELTQEQCIQVYRIISELITNAIKHAKATKIDVIIYQQNNVLKVSVIDNGTGFDTSIVYSNSFGLENIKTRVTQLQGTFNIQSKKNEGTTVTVLIPFNE